MEVGVERIIKSINENEKIVIFGDYDVDGATSSALLARYFNSIKCNFDIYIPDRIKEGYGPNLDAFKKLHARGASLVITVDCGTTAFQPINFASEIGLDTIIVDHHIAEMNLPNAVAVINPNRLDDQITHKQLAAVGVAFLLLVAVNRKLRENGFFSQGQNIIEPNLLELLDIVALGTVADMVPLTGSNRALVIQGLKVMARRKNIGLTALADISGIDEKPNTYHLGFLLGPRVNAGGRVGESYLGAELLSTSSKDRAREIAKQLNEYNSERKEIEEAVFQEAKSLVEKKMGDNAYRSVVFVSGKGWHKGVIGIIASRLKEHYNLPTCVLTETEGVATGSGRSISGVDLGSCIIAARQSGIIAHGGGHAMAAGFSLVADQLDVFENFLSERIRKQILEENIVPTLRVDGLMSIAGATMNLVEFLHLMSPFGTGNPEPRLVFSGVRIAKSNVVGNDLVRCFLSSVDSENWLQAIAFRCVDKKLGMELLNHNGIPLNIAGRLRENNWNGNSTVQLLIDDAAPIS